jgi:hypothetical protein
MKKPFLLPAGKSWGMLISKAPLAFKMPVFLYIGEVEKIIMYV